jgi:hypothetical protein
LRKVFAVKKYSTFGFGRQPFIHWINLVVQIWGRRKKETLGKGEDPDPSSVGHRCVRMKLQRTNESI